MRSKTRRCHISGDGHVLGPTTRRSDAREGGDQAAPPTISPSPIRSRSAHHTAVSGDHGTGRWFDLADPQTGNNYAASTRASLPTLSPRTSRGLQRGPGPLPLAPGSLGPTGGHPPGHARSQRAEWGTWGPATRDWRTKPRGEIASIGWRRARFWNEAWKAMRGFRPIPCSRLARRLDRRAQVEHSRATLREATTSETASTLGLSRDGVLEHRGVRRKIVRWQRGVCAGGMDQSCN